MNPLALLPRFRAAARAMPVLAEAETWSRGQLQHHQLRQLNGLWAAARTHVPYYRELAATHRLPPRFDSLEHYTAVMPVLDKATVRDQAHALLSERREPGRWRTTSGSTGTPMRFYASHRAHRAMLRCQYRFRQMWGVGLVDPTVVLMGAAGGWRGRAADRLRGRLRLAVRGVGPTELRGQLQQMASYGPAAIYGYSRAVWLLACEALASQVRCPSLRVVMLTSETVFDGMRQTIERAWGVPAVVEYGATECGIIACEWPDRTLRVREDHVLVETPARPEGGCDVVLTVLTNPDFPLLRYRIEDVTDAPLQLPDRGFAIMARIGGRNDDWIEAADGRLIHPAEIDAVFEAAPGVRRYRVHQHVDGRIEAMVEPSTGGVVATPPLVTALAGCAGDWPVSVTLTPTIPQTAAGKHRLVTSDRRRSRDPMEQRQPSTVTASSIAGMASGA